MGAVAGKKLEVNKCPLCNTFETKRLTSLENEIKQVLDDLSVKEKSSFGSLQGKRISDQYPGGTIKWSGGRRFTR